jgi:hypothetical protein
MDMKMRKFLFFFFLYPYFVFAQQQNMIKTQFIAKGGLSIVNQSFNAQLTPNSWGSGTFQNALAYNIGLYYDLNVANLISLQTGLGLRQKGSKYLMESAIGKVIFVNQIQYLSYDILLRFTRKLQSFTPYFLIGGRIDYQLAQKRGDFYKTFYLGQPEKNFLFSPVFGGGIEIQISKKRFFIEIEYNPNISNILNPSGIMRNEIRNLAWGLNLGIGF